MGTVRIECEIIRRSASGKAIEIETLDGRRLWLPVSQIVHMPDEDCWYGVQTVVITEWIAEQKELP